jgi:nitronate monooxygenase
MLTLQQLLGIDLPIIQAPMAGVQNSKLAIAVSNSGGLGSLPCAMLSLDVMRQEFAAIRAGTDQPFNANFFCHIPTEPDAAVDHAWRALFADYYREFNIDTANLPQGAARQPFNREMAELVCTFKVDVVSFHFGLPAPDLLALVKSSGAKILSSATTISEAIWLEAHGVDAIIAQGVEAGGHRGNFLKDEIDSQMGTFALLPQIVRAVNVPVIAAGGIADAAGVNAALALGAAGVQIGTAYLLCDEATTSPVHRAALQNDAAQTTVLTNIFSGRPARGIVNRMIRELGPINPAAPAFPQATSASAPLRVQAERAGCGDFSPLWAGQNVTGCRAIGARELTTALIAPPTSPDSPSSPPNPHHDPSMTAHPDAGSSHGSPEDQSDPPRR